MRKEVLVLVLALAVLIAGCKGGGDKGVSSSATPFIGGTEGLRVSFVENAPPKEVLDNPKPADAGKTQVMRFDVILRVENVGEQDVLANGLKTTIGGIYPGDFDKKTEELQNVLFSKLRPTVAKLDGVKKDPEGERIQGSIEEMTFKDLGYVKSLEGNSEFPIQADLCYKYATKAVGDFCMRQDLTKATSGVCQVKGAKPVFSSGAPIHVVSVDETVGGRSKVILKFKIKAVGAGSFFKPDAAGASASGAPNCARGDFSKENFVKVTVNSGVPGLTCSGFSGSPPTGDIRLTNGEASVTCIQDGVNVDALQKVNIQLDYNHLISTSTKILVKHLPTEFAATTATTTTARQKGFEAGTECSVTEPPSPPTQQCTKADGSEGIQGCTGEPGKKGVWSECG